MSEERIREIVRQFPENGMKLLLQTPANVRDLLTLGEFSLLDQLRLEQMTVDPTSYVAADYRHAASDIVLSVPWRVGKAKKRSLWLTILIEHQSDPDRLMMLRVLQYMVLIWQKQVRDHIQKYGSAASVKLQPIVPVVFYTGGYRWERLGQLIDLMVDATDLRQHIPEFQPIYVNLRELSQQQLSSAGVFGEVLRVVQNREESKRPFEQLLGEVLSRLEGVSREERPRWQDLLYYLQALVYHNRPKTEHEHARVDRGIVTDGRGSSGGQHGTKNDGGCVA